MRMNVTLVCLQEGVTCNNSVCVCVCGVLPLFSILIHTHTHTHIILCYSMLLFFFYFQNGWFSAKENGVSEVKYRQQKGEWGKGRKDKQAWEKEERTQMDTWNSLITLHVKVILNLCLKQRQSWCESGWVQLSWKHKSFHLRLSAWTSVRVRKTMRIKVSDRVWRRASQG